MKWFIVFLAACNFLSFFWSVIGVFKKVSDRNLLQYRILQINSALLWIVCTIKLLEREYSDETWMLDVFMLTAQAVCLGVFWLQSGIVKKNGFSIVFSNDLPSRVVMTGLYSRVRHPFYMIYLLCYFSIAIGTQSLAVSALSVSILIIYYIAAKSEEAKFLKSPLAPEYIAYQQKTWMFFPRP